MARELYLPCPGCGSQIRGSIGWFFGTRLRVPRHCAHCGTTLHARCVTCRKRLLDFSPFCPHCGRLVYDGGGPRSQALVVQERGLIELPRRQQKLLDELRGDLDDIGPFLLETFEQLIRLNPVNQRLYTFTSTIAQLTDSTSGPDRARIVATAIEGASLMNVRAALEGFYAEFQSFVAGVFLETERDLDRSWPDHRRFVDLSSLSTLAGFAAGRVRQVLTDSLTSIEGLAQHHHQLAEFLPRYTALMNRSGLVDFLIGLAAGYFGGDAGVAGIKIWDGWRDQTDQQFVQTFSSAIDSFCAAATEYTESTAIAMRPVMAQVVADYLEIQRAIIVQLERCARDGLDVTPIHMVMRSPSKPFEDGGREFMEIVFSSLREKGFPGRSERNVRKLLGM